MSGTDKFQDRYLKGEKPTKLETQSGIPLKEVYEPEDVTGLDYDQKLGRPGNYPFTRGIHSDMYRGRIWTQRSLTGYGSPKMANERIKFLFDQGAAAWSVAPDSPLVAGLDPDHPLARNGVGLNGTSLCCLEDVETYLEGLPLGKVSVNQVCSQPGAAFWLAAYVAVAEKQGIAPDTLIGGVQNDPLQQLGGMLEAQTGFLPLDIGVRLSCDVIEWCALNAPKINTLCINAYNLREHGITAVEEIAFGVASATALARNVLSRGRVSIDDFAPRISFFCAANMDFFEEIAKLRAFRRIYARIMKEELKAKNPRSWWFRCAVETSGNSLTTQQPLNNIVRATVESMAAVLGGCQSLTPACFDEGLAIPSELGATIALRTMQVIAHESNIVSSADPLGGSYLIESLTNDLEEEANKLLEEIEQMGGMIEAMKTGWRDKRLIEGQHKYQDEIRAGERVIVGLNSYKSEEVPVPGGIFEVSQDITEERVAFVKEFREKRDSNKTRVALDILGEKVATEDNLIPAMIEAVKANATLGEISDTLRSAAGFKIRV